MPWLLTSPGHQQPWHWLYRICWSFSYLRKCFKYLCQINMEEWHKMQIYVYVPSENFARKGLRYNHYLVKGTKAGLDNLPLYDSSLPAQLWHPDCCMSSLLPSSGGECINFKYNAVELLEQLERLRSEDTPRRLMITHTIESYWIPSQGKTKSKLQI